MTVLIVNHGIDNRCGVHSFGLRFYESLSGSKHNIAYVEINSEADYFAACEQHKPDVVIFNYMPVVMPWVSPSLGSYKAKRIALQHLYDNTNIDSIAHSYGDTFHYVAVLDPSIKPSNKVFVWPRVIPTVECPPPSDLNPIRIGTFGFALPHKQIPLIASEINKCFDRAVFNLHLTEAYFNGAQGEDIYTTRIYNECRAAITKPDIAINLTTDFRSDNEIVSFLSQNHINALFYSIPPDNIGRSSSIDYMIAAERPILVTHCDSFKHAEHLICKYPETQFSDIANDYEHHLHQAMRLKLSMKSDIVSAFDLTIDSIL